MSTKILFLAGSARKDSSNKKLAKAAYRIASDLKADATFIDLKDFDLPIYNGDIETESGLPENAKALKQLFIEHDAIFIASPEYNGSFSPLLKNSIDWISRPHVDNEPPLAAFNGKVAAICGASPGGLGGLRGLVPLRMLLGNILMLVIPDQLALGGSYQAFDEEGNLIDANNQKMLTNVIEKMIAAVGKN